MRLLRVVHAARAEHGAEVVGRLYEALGGRIFEIPPLDEQVVDGVDVRERPSSSRLCSTRSPPVDLVRRLDDELDDGIRRETDEALELTGKDVGTPIIHFRPPDGVAFFGPVISRPRTRRARSGCGTTWSGWRGSWASPAQAQPA